MIRRCEYQIPEKIYPYSILGISRYSSPTETKSQFKLKIISPDREQRAYASLAYDMITSKDPKSFKKNADSSCEVIKRNPFYYVSIGNLNFIKIFINYDESFLTKTDDLGRTLLYKAARNGFFDICKYLLESGSNINKTQIDGSTPLHAAAFYGHTLIVELLLEYSINIHLKNNLNHLAADEACNTNIRDLIINSYQDKILGLLEDIRVKKLADDVLTIKKGNRVVGKRIVLKKSSLFDKENWVQTWHGTKFQHLISIAENGLQPPGSRLKSGKMIETQQGHIKLGIRLGQFNNWAEAIFISPSIFYASDIVYSERIVSQNVRFCCIVEVLARKNAYTEHSHTLLARANLPGEPSSLEYRIEDRYVEKSIFRVEDSNFNNLKINSILFVSTDFLERCTEYTDANIFE